MTEATDCPACPSCGLPCGTPAMASATTFYALFNRPASMRCSACGHWWHETDLDKVAQAWRAEAAYDAQKETAT